MQKFDVDKEKLEQLSRDKYMKVYNYLGSKMFSECYIPNVKDFTDILLNDDETAKQKLHSIAEFTDNEDEILESLKKKTLNYTDSESEKFLKKVIAANITDITQSGYFYKKLMASADNMRINVKVKDCNSDGQEYLVKDITEDIYNYKIKFLYITELDNYTETYNEFCEKIKGLEIIHVRDFLTCKCSKNHKTFCRKCAGIYKRSHTLTFIPKYIGAFSTLQITEHATQASLDSMNNGTSESLNVLLEQNLQKEKFNNYEAVKNKITSIINDIGSIGVQARYYQIALLSRFYRLPDDSYSCKSLVNSFSYQDDKLGRFIYQPTYKHFMQLMSTKGDMYSTSLKTQIMLDEYY